MEGSGGCDEGPERSILSQEKKKYKYIVKLPISANLIKYFKKIGLYLIYKKAYTLILSK